MLGNINQISMYKCIIITNNPKKSSPNPITIDDIEGVTCAKNNNIPSSVKLFDMISYSPETGIANAIFRFK